MNAAAIYYALRDRVLILKLAGTIRIAARDSGPLSAAFEVLIRRLPEMDFDQLLIDLTEGVTIDSTYLGLLAQTAGLSPPHVTCQPVIFSVNEDINAILEGVGFGEVFLIVHQAPSPTPELQPVNGTQPSETDRLETFLRAHRALAKLNPGNAEQFRSVIELLDDELRQKRAQERHGAG